MTQNCQCCKKFNFDKMRSEQFKDLKVQNGGNSIMFSNDLKNKINEYMIDAHKKMHFNKKVTKNTSQQHYKALTKLMNNKMNKLFNIKAGGKVTCKDAQSIL